MYAMEATFDGGVREVRGIRVGGAGATLWRLDDNTGLRVKLAAATMALPHVTDSQEAKAWGAHLAMRILLKSQGSDRRVRINGDNLAIVCHCAAPGRLHRPGAQAVSEPALSRILACGWRVAWQAVRRRLNVATEDEATEGVFWARRIRGEDAPRRQWRVRWFEC